MLRKYSDQIQETWNRISSPDKQVNIIRGIVDLAMSTGQSPEDFGKILGELSDKATNKIAFIFGPPDGEIVRKVGRSLRENSEKQAR
jgi:hypothetical protein